MIPQMPKAPGYFERTADDEHNAIAPSCFDFNGAHSCPAPFTGFAYIGGLVVLMLQRGPNGLHVQLTPTGARRMADDLRMVADQVEAMHAQEAATQLAATLAKKG